MNQKIYPRIMGHLICESLGYLTPSMAQKWIEAYKKGEEFYCEWYYDLRIKGIKQPTKYIIKKAIQNRHYHRGPMKNYKVAKELVTRYLRGEINPQFASWF